jgi:anaerobic ribonucleoside-triphosphate reductase
VMLQPHARQTVTFAMDEKDHRIWDLTLNDWRVVRGTFTVYVGSSSRAIRLTTTVVL